MIPRRIKLIKTSKVINLNGVKKLKNINCRIGTKIIDPITANAFIGNNYVATLSPNTSINPGPEMVDIPLLVNPRKNINIIKVGFVVEKMPNNLTTRSTTMIANIVFPISSLSPKHPQIKVPIRAVTVLTTRQYPRK